MMMLLTNLNLLPALFLGLVGKRRRMIPARKP